MTKAQSRTARLATESDTLTAVNIASVRSDEGSPVLEDAACDPLTDQLRRSSPWPCQATLESPERQVQLPAALR